jgi:small-conductance mechanosensitive channel
MGNAFMELAAQVKTAFSGVLTKVVLAAIVLLLGFIIGKLVGKLTQKVLHEFDLDKALRAAGLKLSLEELIAMFVTYTIYFVAIVMTLDQLGLNTVVFNVIAFGVIAIIILSVILAIKDLIPNMFAGVFIHQKRWIRVGDKLKLRDLEGKVVYINLFETKLKTKRGDIIFIPNSALIKEKVVKLKR